MKFLKFSSRILAASFFCISCAEQPEQPEQPEHSAETQMKTEAEKKPHTITQYTDEPAEILVVPELSQDEIDEIMTPPKKWLSSVSDEIQRKIEARDFVWKHNGKELQLGVVEDNTGEFHTWEESPKFWQMDPNIHQFPVILTDAPKRFGPPPSVRK